MGTDNLYWKRKNKALKRKSQTRNYLESFLIVCEGQKTEPNYFKAFRLRSATVRVEGCAMNTLSLVKKTIEIKESARKDGEIYDQTWCVFDRDEHLPGNFNNAIKLAKEKKIRIAYSNEAFELWYLLHFHYSTSALPRADYVQKLSELMKKPYKKNSTEMYHLLLDKQERAIENANKLLKSYNRPNPVRDNPSTTVHQLVMELNKYLLLTQQG